MNKKGFTLIELLVVIAIIGILTSVVLASLNSARSKGADAGVKDNLSSIRTQAEMYYDGTGANTYGPVFAAAVCPTTGTSMFVADPTIKAAIAAAVAAGGSTAPVSSCAAGNPAATGNATAWAAQVQLKTLNGTTAQYWCVDSAGTAATTSNSAVLGGGNSAASTKCQ